MFKLKGIDYEDLLSMLRLLKLLCPAYFLLYLQKSTLLISIIIISSCICKKHILDFSD